MSLTASELSCADIAAVMGANRGNDGGFGFDGNSGWWVILLFLLLGNGGWGNGYGGGNGGAGGLYPWMNQAEITSDGFRDQMLNNNITSIRDSIGDISTRLCNGFAGIEQGANARQIANMNQAFATQTAMMQGFNTLGSQFADCCCENRLASADLKYTIATENCADRAALSDGIRDVIASQTASTQKILDKLCEQEIQAKDDLIGQLRQEVLFARGQASQIAQNEQIVNQIYNRLDTCPVGTTPVYGRTPIFTCNPNQGCGCNGNFYN